MRKFIGSLLQGGAKREWAAPAAGAAAAQSEAIPSTATETPLEAAGVLTQRTLGRPEWSVVPDADADEKDETLVDRMAQLPLPDIHRAPPPPPRAGVSRSLPGTDGAVSSILGREYQEVSGRLNGAQLREMFELQAADPLEWGGKELGEKFDVLPETVSTVFRYCYTPAISKSS